jgi:hypothetical protein
MKRSSAMAGMSREDEEELAGPPDRIRRLAARGGEALAGRPQFILNVPDRIDELP